MSAKTISMSNRSQILIWVIPPLLALAAFCFYGVLATYEPPGWPILRIVYAAGVVLCLAGTFATCILARKVKS